MNIFLIVQMHAQSRNSTTVGLFYSLYLFSTDLLFIRCLITNGIAIA